MKTAKMLLGISPFFVLIPLVVLLFRYRYLTASLRWTGCYILLCSITGFVSYALWCKKENNLGVLHFQTTLELPLLFLAMYSEINNSRIKSVVFATITVFMLFSIFNSIYLQSLSTYNSNSQLLGSLLIIAFCVYYFIDLLRQMKVKSLNTTPMFWITSSLLIYYASSLFLYGLGNVIVYKSHLFNIWIWVFHALLTVIHYSLISIGVWRSKTT